METIFVVEDDENIRDLIIYALNNAGFNPVGLDSGANLDQEIQETRPSLIILDIMLPGRDGFMILEDLRSSPLTQNLPVIFLTAKTSEIHRVKGLDLGADDYVLKPFSVIELISRVRAVLRRAGPAKPKDLIQVGDLEISPSSRTLKIQGQLVDLTYKEFELLDYLILNNNIVLTRESIMNQVWGFDFQGETRTIDVHIGSLRQKLGPYGDLIETVRNVGYKAVLP